MASLVSSLAPTSLPLRAICPSSPGDQLGLTHERNSGGEDDDPFPTQAASDLSLEAGSMVGRSKWASTEENQLPAENRLSVARMRSRIFRNRSASLI